MKNSQNKKQDTFTDDQETYAGIDNLHLYRSPKRNRPEIHHDQPAVKEKKAKKRQTKTNAKMLRLLHPYYTTLSSIKKNERKYKNQNTIHNKLIRC